MGNGERVYWESSYVTVKRSQIVIQPYTGRPAWLDWLLGHPGERTVAMQSVDSIEISKPSKVRPVLVIAVGLLLSFVGVGIPIAIIGAVWLSYVNRFGTIVKIMTGAGPVNLLDLQQERQRSGIDDDEKESIVKAVQNALADQG